MPVKYAGAIDFPKNNWKNTHKISGLSTNQGDFFNKNG